MADEIKTDALTRVEYQGTALKELQFNGVSVWPRETVITATISGTISGVTLHAWLRNNTSWDGTTVLRATVYMGIAYNPAKIIGNVSTLHGLECNLSSFPAGSHIELIWRNTVDIRGGGGEGGGRVVGVFSSSGRNGGDAITVSGTGSTLVLDFNGYDGVVVRGAGGGGYVAATYSNGPQAPMSHILGGGGGAGTPPGKGGVAVGADNNVPGNDGTEYLSGLGVSSVVGYSGNGGNSQTTGGSVGHGSVGAITVSARDISIGSAGSAGWAVRGNSNITMKGQRNVNFVGTVG